MGREPYRASGQGRVSERTGADLESKAGIYADVGGCNQSVSTASGKFRERSVAACSLAGFELDLDLGLNLRLLVQ